MATCGRNCVFVVECCCFSCYFELDTNWYCWRARLFLCSQVDMKFQARHGRLLYVNLNLMSDGECVGRTIMKSIRYNAPFQKTKWLFISVTVSPQRTVKSYSYL